MTNNIERRVFEHKNKLVKGFTSKYNVTLLVYYKSYSEVLDALKKEKQMKKWNRQWKIDLIEIGNPDWKDLAVDWYLDYD
jgi:putative endonuclease